MQNNPVYLGVVEGYRHVITERYQYDLLKDKYNFPATFTRKKFTELEDYFLEYIYPPISKRKKLDDAFESLDRHIKNPRFLWSILVDSAGILFKYGASLPKILGTAIKALRSFRSASQFEDKLADVAIQSGANPPFTTSEIKKFIAKLSRDKVNKFIEEGLILFKTLHDRQLINKIIDVTDHIILKMKKKPKIYSAEEIHGLELGREIIKVGNHLFDRLENQEQHLLFELVVQIERDAIDDIYAKYV